VTGSLSLITKTVITTKAILPQHYQFLGFSLFFRGELRFFQFTVLPLALSLGPYHFTEIQRALVKHWRSKGYRVFTYLDDGADADQVLNKAMKMSTMVCRDIALSSFIASEEKTVGSITIGRTSGFYSRFTTWNFLGPGKESGGP